MRNPFVAILIGAVVVGLNAQQPETPVTIGPKDVRPGSISFVGKPEDSNHNVTFELRGKTSDEIRKIRDSHRVRIANAEGLTVIPMIGCSGLVKYGTNYIGLVLVTTNYAVAKLAATTLAAESSAPAKAPTPK